MFHVRSDFGINADNQADSECCATAARNGMICRCRCWCFSCPARLQPAAPAFWEAA